MKMKLMRSENVLKRSLCFVFMIYLPARQRLSAHYYYLLSCLLSQMLF